MMIQPYLTISGDFRTVFLFLFPENRKRKIRINIFQNIFFCIHSVIGDRIHHMRHVARIINAQRPGPFSSTMTGNPSRSAASGNRKNNHKQECTNGTPALEKYL